LNHRKNGSELFLIDEPGTFLDVGDDGWLDKVTWTVRGAAATHDTPLFPRLLQKCLHLFVLGAVLQRADPGALRAAIIDRPLSCLSDKLGAHLIVDGFVNI